MFAERLRGRHNAFGLIRLVLAALVIVSHAFPIGGWGHDPMRDWTGGQAELGDIAVLGFFAVSGFLVTRSAARLDLVQFVWRRALRILPGFYVLLIVTAVVIGPWFFYRLHETLDGYVTVVDGPIGYVLFNATLLITQFGIHDIFTVAGDVTTGGATSPSVMNGSLWTLWFEWLCYMLAAALALVGALTRRRWMLPVVTVAMFVLAHVAPWVPVLSGFTGTAFTRLATIFLVGACIAMFADTVPFDRRLGLASLAAVVVTLAAGIGFSTIGHVALAYGILWVAGSAPSSLRKVGSVHDISYGVYIYAWPVQAGLADYGVQQLGLLPYIVICMIVTAVPATASWWLVERPSLEHKDWGPGLGWSQRKLWFSGLRR